MGRRKGSPDSGDAGQAQVKATDLCALMSAADRRYAAIKCAEKIVASAKSPALIAEALSILAALEGSPENRS